MSEFYDIKYNKYNNNKYANRYKNCKILTDRETEETILSTRDIKDIPMSSNDFYHEVTITETNRFDILAQEYYGNSLLWWVIAQANDIYDPFKPIAPGTVLRIPSIDSLYGATSVL